MTKTGIYAITCLESKKMYIGKSKDISSRWCRHKDDLRKGRGVNAYIQSAWALYGENKFVFSVLEECKVEELTEKEVYWIRHYDTTNNEKGYNILENFNRAIKKPESNKKKNPEGRVYPSQPVICIDEVTGEVCALESSKEVAEVLNSTLNSVQECLATWKGTSATKKRWTIKGFILTYLEDYNEQANYLTFLNPIRIEEAKYDKRRDQEGTPIKAINIETGEVQVFKTKAQMCRDLNLLKPKVLNAIKLDKQYRGYKFQLDLAKQN